jgi:hypothetical protein
MIPWTFLVRMGFTTWGIDLHEFHMNECIFANQKFDTFLTLILNNSLHILILKKGVSGVLKIVNIILVRALLLPVA